MSEWRPGILAACLLTLVLAGCITTPEEPAPQVEEPAAEPAEERVPPEPIEETETVTGSADPMNFLGFGICQTPTAKCYSYEFTTNVSTAVDAQLTWMVPVHDFDLYLMNGEEQIDVAGDTPPETLESFISDIRPGTYQLVVVAWAVGADTFTLKATFS